MSVRRRRYPGGRRVWPFGETPAPPAPGQRLSAHPERRADRVRAAGERGCSLRRILSDTETCGSRLLPGTVVGGSDLRCRGRIDHVAEVHLGQPGTEFGPAQPRRRNAVLVDLGPRLERRLTLMRSERVRVKLAELDVHLREPTARADDNDAGFAPVQEIVAVTALEADADAFSDRVCQWRHQNDAGLQEPRQPVHWDMQRAGHLPRL